jgi:hypothetical protein
MIASVEAQGTVFAIRQIVPSRAQPKELQGTKRGDVREFSRNSRRRLMVKMARLAIQKTRTTFLTLTFSQCPNWDFARIALKRFLMRLRRKYSRMSAVWRLERQERGAIHFHLLVFNMPYWAQDKIQEAWQECTEEERSIVHVKLVRNKKMLMQYTSKYVAKRSPRIPPSLDESTYQHAQGETGRHWGIVNAEKLPFAPIARRLLDISAHAKRYTWWAIQSESRKHAGNHEEYALLFTDCAYQMLDYLVSIADIPDDEINSASLNQQTQFRALMTREDYVHELVKKDSYW